MGVAEAVDPLAPVHAHVLLHRLLDLHGLLDGADAEPGVVDDVGALVPLDDGDGVARDRTLDLGVLTLAYDALHCLLLGNRWTWK